MTLRRLTPRWLDGRMNAVELQRALGALVPDGEIPVRERMELVLALAGRAAKAPPSTAEHTLLLKAARTLLVDLLLIDGLESAPPEGSFPLTAAQIKARCGSSVFEDAVCIVTRARTHGLPLGDPPTHPVEQAPPECGQPDEDY